MNTERDFVEVAVGAHRERRGDQPHESHDLGWLFLTSWRKAHYFRDSRRSLCGKWGALGHPEAMFEPETGASSNDCAACRRKLDREGIS